MTTAPTAGSLWRHTGSNNPYVVMAVAKLEKTGEQHVVYRRADLDPSAAESVVWIRPLFEWEEVVTWKKSAVTAPRFVPLEPL